MVYKYMYKAYKYYYCKTKYIKNKLVTNVQMIKKNILSYLIGI